MTDKVAGQCGYCGFVLDAAARFCGGCGRPRTMPTLIGAHALSFLQSKVPAALIDRIHSGTPGPGERKHVTVLFADIRGSTELIDGLDPEEALEVIGPILQRIMDAVHQHDGLVNQTRGDGVMALFGAPIASEDHGVQACRAALAIRETIHEFNQASQRGIEVRIGVNSGHVVIHSIGNNLSMNYDAVGKSVHLAARMEELAAPGKIMLASSTFQLAKGFISALPLGMTKVKGVSSPVETYELVAMRLRTRWQARSSNGLSPLTGRRDELGRLKQLLDSAKAARGQAVTIVGAAGMGKSRLIHEFLASLSDEWLVFEAACAPQRINSSYFPISTLMRSIFRVDLMDTPSSAANRVRAQMARFDPELMAHQPAIFSLLDLAIDDGDWKTLEPPERRKKIIEAIKALMLYQERFTPLVILMEDVHWIDAETQLVMNNLIGAIGTARILIITTQRPERMWIPLKIGRLNLTPLGENDSDQLFVSLLGADGSLRNIRRQILDRAQGNPLFVEELARSLRDGKIIIDDLGQYKVKSGSTKIEIPETIHSVLASRIDLLEPATKSLLQMASVIGKDVPIALLAGMAGTDADELAERLQALESADFLRKVDTPSALEYSFKHELTREVAYGMMLLSIRRYLHAKAIEIIELRFADRRDEHIDQLADHACAAELWQKAVPYQLRSCQRAIRRGANQDAVANYERGLASLMHWPESRNKTIAEMDLHLTVITALEPLGMHRRIAEVLREAGRLAESTEEPWRVAAVNCQLAVALWRLGYHGEALPAARLAQTIAERIGEPILIFAAFHQLGIVHHETGDFTASLAYHEKCLELETPEVDQRRAGWAALPSVMLRTFMTDTLIDLGDFGRAEVLAEDGCRRADAANHAYSRANINHVFSRLRIAQGRPAEALRLLRDSWQSCLNLEMKQMYPIFAARMGEAYLALGDVKAALEILSVPEQLDIPLAEHAFGWRYLFIAQGKALLAARRYDGARAVAKRALALAEERGEPPQSAYAQLLLGDIARAIAKADMSLATQYYSGALALAEQCSMRPLARLCRNSLADLVA